MICLKSRMSKRVALEREFGCQHNQFDTCCHNGFINFIPLSCKTLIYRLSSRRHFQASLSANSPVVSRSGMGSNPAGDIYFHFEFFNPSLFRTAQWIPCKWNQARPFTCYYSCFRPQIQLDNIVVGTITGAPLLPFCVLVTEAWM